MKNIIFGIASTTLSADEIDFFKESQPYGIVLFTRNIANKEQLKDLNQQIKHHLSNTKIFVDQEGGRVATRIKANILNYEFPAAIKFAEIYRFNQEEAINLCYNNYLLIGKELNNLGFDGCFAPVADLTHNKTHNIISEHRSFGSNVEQVVGLAQAAYNGLSDAGIIGCVKHIPGHGLATVDSHLELPIVEEDIEFLLNNDFKVFKTLNYKMAMSAHIVYQALDPVNPITMSHKALSYLRNNIINPNAMLVSDAIEMKALKEPLPIIAEQALAAGIDILLHCTGNLKEMKEIIPYTSKLNDKKINYLEVQQENMQEIAEIKNKLANNKILKEFFVHYA